MTLFFLSAALLVVVALALLLVGPMRARASAERESDLRATNVSLARERRTELAAALADGAIDATTHAVELARVEQDLAAELAALPERTTRDGGIPAMVLVAVVVPIAAGALYLRLGDPGAVTRATDAGRQSAAAGGGAQAPLGPVGSGDGRDAGQATGQGSGAGPGAGPGAEGSTQAPALAELLPRLEERLAREPGDVDGWRLLGRSYLGIEEFGRAASALRRAVELDEDAATLGQLAEAVAMERGGELAGEPVTLLERAVELDPAAPQGLWLLAIARQQAGEHARALQLFERLRTAVAADTEAVATIDDMMARSRTELGESPREPSESGTAVAPSEPAPPTDATPAAVPAAEASTADDQTGDTATTGMSVSLRVDISDEARADVSPDDVVFVYARASEGPPMPLAVARYMVSDLPVEVTLDEGMAMMPSMSLADFPRVTVGARVSRSGNAIAAAGDWLAERDNVSVGDGTALMLNIDTRRP